MTHTSQWKAPDGWTQRFACEVRSLMCRAAHVPAPEADDHGVEWQVGPLTLSLRAPTPDDPGRWRFEDKRTGLTEGGELASDVLLTYPTGHTRRVSICDDALVMFAFGRIAEAAAGVGYESDGCM